MSASVDMDDEEYERSLDHNARLALINKKKRLQEMQKLKKFNDKEKVLNERIEKRKVDLVDYVTEKKDEWDQKLGYVKKNIDKSSSEYV